MCCDICPTYLECEENKRLKDECCKECPEYDYCQGKKSYNPDTVEGEDYEKEDFF